MPPNARWWILGGVALVALVLAAIINAPAWVAWFYRVRQDAAVSGLPTAPPFQASDRVLVVSPHPDDESLACGGQIQQALAAGAQVWIVWLTAGDGFEWDAVVTNRTLRPVGTPMRELALRRQQEARRAAEILGVPAAHEVFLGYPDGGLLHMFFDYYDQPYTSRYTGLRAVALPGALNPGAAYTGANLQDDLQSVLTSVDPTVVLAPSPMDRHPDHRAAGDVVLRILGQRGQVDLVRWWIVHGGVEWPLPKGLHVNLPLVPPPRGAALPWQQVPLTRDQEAVKEQAIRAHRSQTEVESRFMLAFVRANELVATEPLP